MPYFVHITDADRAYLTGLSLSDTAKERVEDFIEYAIAQVEEAFRNDPANRTQPNTRYSCFYHGLAAGSGSASPSA